MGGNKMFEKMIEDLKSKILEAVERYLKSHEKANQYHGKNKRLCIA